MIIVTAPEVNVDGQVEAVIQGMGGFTSHVAEACGTGRQPRFGKRGQLWQLQMCGSAFLGCDFLLVLQGCSFASDVTMACRRGNLQQHD